MELNALQAAQICYSPLMRLECPDVDLQYRYRAIALSKSLL